MRVAVERVQGWDELKPATKGDNAWLFVNEEVRPLACSAAPGGAWGRVGGL